VRIEAEAKLRIQEQIREGALELVWSYVLDFENAANPFDERRRTIANWRQFAGIDVDETDDVLEYADALVKSGLKAKDAMHLACAIAGECAYFLTTDDDILKRRHDVKAVAISEPAAFVREMNL
jgi:predicted nucleic acid-binding protein